MKVNFHCRQLSEALSAVSTIAPRSSPIDHLKLVKVIASEDGVLLVATDREVGIRHPVEECEVEQPGEALLDLKLLSPILRETTADTIRVSVEDGKATVTTGMSQFDLASVPVDEYPDVEGFSDVPGYARVPATRLKTMLSQVLFTCDEASTRYVLGGVLFELDDGTITLAATDSRRLAVTRADCSCSGEMEGVDRPVLPAKALKLVQKILPAGEEDGAEIALRTNDALIRSGGVTVWTRLIEGRFPKYQDVIPAEFGHQVDLTVGPLLNVIRQARIVTSEETKGVDFTFKSDGVLTLKGASEGAAAEVSQVISYEGEEQTLTFDPKFWEEYLRVLDNADLVTFRWIDAGSAAMLDTGGAYRYLVMPLSRS